MPGRRGAFRARGLCGPRSQDATFPGTLPEPLRDDARAAELLELLADGREPGYGRFAAFLSAQVAEHARLAREAERTEALRTIERGILERDERLRRRDK
jgi:hypothetical protein